MEGTKHVLKWFSLICWCMKLICGYSTVKESRPGLRLGKVKQNTSAVDFGHHLRGAKWQFCLLMKCYMFIVWGKIPFEIFNSGHKISWVLPVGKVFFICLVGFFPCLFFIASNLLKTKLHIFFFLVNWVGFSRPDSLFTQSPSSCRESDFYVPSLAPTSCCGGGRAPASPHAFFLSQNGPGGELFA